MQFIFFQLFQYQLICVMRKPDFAYAKTKAQINCAVTALLISAFVFAIWIVKFRSPLITNFKLLSLHRLVCVRHGRKP